jgi:hypothetical protein
VAELDISGFHGILLGKGGNLFKLPAKVIHVSRTVLLGAYDKRMKCEAK